ncbi:MAG: DUF1501 domain-containing protein, partial [Verrucomicrobiales bacterium]|nr:DUF1501 domain-containing protein [Verrucomicrobiales bacterium]
MNTSSMHRREFLRTTSNGFGYLAFAAMAARASAAETAAGGSALAHRAPHFPARAKHVIFLCMQG